MVSIKKYGSIAAAVLVAAALLGLSVYTARLRSQVAERDRTIAHQVDERAKQLGALRVETVKAGALADHLGKENVELLAQLRKIDARVAPVLHASVKAFVEDRVQLTDQERRFTLAPDLKSLVRRQAFSLDVLVIRNVQGKIEIGKVSLQELDPDTKAKIDSQFALESRVEVVDGLSNPRVSVFHPRLVGGIELHGWPLLGVEILNGERFGGLLSHVNLSLLGVYNPRDKAVLGGASIGWRLFNSNVTVGPAFFYPSKQFGALVSVELTR